MQLGQVEQARAIWIPAIEEAVHVRLVGGYGVGKVGCLRTSQAVAEAGGCAPGSHIGRAVLCYAALWCGVVWCGVVCGGVVWCGVLRCAVLTLGTSKPICSTPTRNSFLETVPS